MVGGASALQWAATNTTMLAESNEPPWEILAIIFIISFFAPTLLMLCAAIYKDFRHGVFDTRRNMWENVKDNPKFSLFILSFVGLLVAITSTMISAAFFIDTQAGWLIVGVVLFYLIRIISTMG